MQKALWSGLTTIAVGFASPAVALTVQEVPNPRQANGSWVTDMAGVLSTETEAEINRLITELEAETGSEMAVVTVPETAPAATPKAFATELFNTWGIGKADRNNGVLFLISIGDRRAEIETGYGIESILPDEQVNKILERAVTPHYKDGNYDRGTLAGTQALAEALGDQEPANFLDWLIATAVVLFFLGFWGLVCAFIGWIIYSILTSKSTSTQSNSSIDRSYDSHDSHDSHDSSDFGGGESGGGGSGSDW